MPTDTGIPPQADPVFVQPITVGDSVDYVDDRTRANKHLDGVQRPNARVAIWLLARYKNTAFHEAAKQSIMPADVGKTLTDEELGDLAAFLLRK